MPLSWTPSKKRAELEKGALLLLLLLLGLFVLAQRPVRNNSQNSYPTPRDAFQKITLGQKVHINKESQEGLMAIPRVTERMAQLIIEHRQRHGPIRDLETLERVLHRYRERLRDIIPHISFEMD